MLRSMKPAEPQHTGVRGRRSYASPAASATSPRLPVVPHRGTVSLRHGHRRRTAAGL